MHLTDEQLAVISGATFILVWPDATWCHPDNRVEFEFMGDDYTRFFYLPDYYTDDQLDVAAVLISRGWSRARVHSYLATKQRLTCSSGA
jgi:hypothetical protein